MRSSELLARPGRAIAAAAVIAVAAAGIAAPAVAADEPLNVALASGDNAPTLEVSYVTGWNSAAALNNGETGPTDDYGQMWGTWGDPSGPAQDWASYTWDAPVTVDGTTLSLWQNHLTGDSGVMLPTGWQIEYLDDAGEWAAVDAEYPLPVLDPDDPVSSQPAVEASFDAVTTTGVRLTLDRADVDGELKATSVVEWEVWGENADVPPPEPEDPGDFIDAERIAVRTTTGEEPALPDELWVVEQDGPLAYVPVEWAEVDDAAYAAPGSFEVAGSPEGYDGQEVTATVHVADELSDEIASVDYTSVVTTPGTAPVLPRTVRAAYADGTASSGVGVEWAAIDAASYAEADAFFDVAGTVDGYPDGAIATVFVVEPAAQDGPLVSLSLDSAAPGSGWYTTAPTASVSVEAAGSAVESVEYSLDGETWHAYDEPFAVDVEGEVTVSARATDADGATGEAARDIRIDTRAPVTEVDYEVVDGTSARITLTASDAEPGSGVTRTVWADGPDENPEGEENNFFATYEDPFSVQLTDEPRYVHVQTQDAAGNLEAYVTVELPRRGAGSLDIEPTVASRCVAGSAVLVVTAANGGDAAVEVTATTDFGERAFEVPAGRAVSKSFSTRTPDLAAGEVRVTAESGDGEFSADVPYAARSCG